MNFYIVSTPVELIEPAGLGKWFPSLFYILNPNPPMKPREMDATIMEEHLRSVHC